ncbi:MAG: hypothetical protein M3Z26_00615 [Bacteroidota bacterium]|nr:hypothetical protein [Bacteroidota bacterium]
MKKIIILIFLTWFVTNIFAQKQQQGLGSINTVVHVAGELQVDSNFTLKGQNLSNTLAAKLDSSFKDTLNYAPPFNYDSPTKTLSLKGLVANYISKTANYTATINDYTIDCTTGTFTITLPTAIGNTGRIYVITNSGSGTITLATTSSQTFTNVSATPTTLSMSTVGSITVQSNGASWLEIAKL